jgi:hypothetical protein
MGINRIVVYDFEDGAVGAPFQSKGNYYPDGNYGDLYGGIDGPNAFVASGANSPLTPPVYASPGYQSTRSLELRNKMSDPLPRDGSPSSSYPYYTWNDGWGYRPDMNPPRLGRVCGIEVTFKVDPSVIRETIVSVALETFSHTPNRAYNNVSWSITSNPQYNGGGVWYGGWRGADAAGNVLGPGDTLFQGDASDTLHVDLTQWLTAKLLPTGEWSLTYAGGATIMSGQLSPDARDGGASLDIAVDTTNRGRPLNDTGDPTGWIDNIVFWVADPPPPPPPALAAEFTFTSDATGRMVTFDGSASTGDIVDYSWDFDENYTVLPPVQPADGPILEHMFYSFGPFWVTLTVTDGDGNTDRVIHEVDLTGLRIDGDYVDDRCAFSGAS